MHEEWSSDPDERFAERVERQGSRTSDSPSAAEGRVEAPQEMEQPSAGAEEAAVEVPATGEAEIAGGGPRMLDPRFVTQERVSSWITTVLISTAAGVGALITALAADLAWVALLCGSAWLLLTVTLSWMSHQYPRWFYERARYTLSEKGIEIRRGVWWRQVLDVPRSRVQHTDVTQGPLMRRFGLARLTVHTAGTQNASVDLNGLDHATALIIRDFLIRGGESDGT